MIESLVIANIWMAILAEACGEGRQGMTAVACVFRNRINAGMDIGSSALKRKDLKKFIKAQGEDIEIQAKAIAIRVFRGGEPDITNGALFFESTDFKKPKWAKGKTEVFRCGKHIFYR
jgi:spore germination cell wall hydrolase CwlJ-like protein